MTRIILFIGLVLAACSQPITINNFDQEAWIADKDGCNGTRKEIVILLEQNKDKILGKDQAQIKTLLGLPDMHEIYRRSQRFYIYSIEPGSSCKNYKADKTQANLTLRFNAMGRVHEVVYYK